MKMVNRDGSDVKIRISVDADSYGNTSIGGVTIIGMVPCGYHVELQNSSISCQVYSLIIF